MVDSDIRICICAYMHAYIHTYVSLKSTQQGVRPEWRTQIHAYTHTFIYIYIYIHMIYIYTYIHQSEINSARREARLADSDILMTKLAAVIEEAMVPVVCEVDIKLLKETLENPMFIE
jgi:hypothetical protein